MLIDTHCHLDAAEFADDRSAQIDAARAAGVGRFLVPAVDAGNLDAVAALSAAHADCRHAFGIHPMYVARAQADDLERIRS
ncbi:MAG TPA: TatD family hydrolase, partial [Rhodocyclaceae bacterium]|nr:TatD family hydrolase [Rhodocyclaceae bacterium]